MTERLAAMAMGLADGDFGAVADWLKRLGCVDVEWSEGQMIVTGLTGMRVGLMASDPVTCAAQLGFATAGVYWPHVYPELLKQVNKEWKERRQAMGDLSAGAQAGGKEPAKECIETEARQLKLGV